MNIKKIQPLGENVLGRIVKKDAKTKSGLVLPDTASEDSPQEGVVIALGNSKDIKVKINQNVVFAKYSGFEIKIEEEEYLIVKNDDILAIIK